MLGHAQRAYGALVSLLKYCGKLQRRTNTEFNKKTDPRHQLMFMGDGNILSLSTNSQAQKGQKLPDERAVLCNGEEFGQEMDTF